MGAKLFWNGIVCMRANFTKKDWILHWLALSKWASVYWVVPCGDRCKFLCCPYGLQGRLALASQGLQPCNWVHLKAEMPPVQCKRLVQTTWEARLGHYIDRPMGSSDFGHEINMPNGLVLKGLFSVAKLLNFEGTYIVPPFWFLEKKLSPPKKLAVRPWKWAGGPRGKNRLPSRG